MNMSEEKEHTDFNHLITRYLSGELNPDELTAFRAELERDPGKQKLLGEYRKIWDSTATAEEEESYDLDREWRMMKDRIPGFERPRIRTLMPYGYRIAAVLVLGLLLTFSWFYLNPKAGLERAVAGNEPVELTLDDGTRVMINRHSSLRFSKNFDQEERKIFLSGEAWFEVSRDTARPFIIDAGAAIVEVLGTSFNVNAYKENPVVEITVESGMVGLSAKQDSKDLIVMKAGSGGTYNKAERELKLIPRTDPNSISWRTRELFFEGSTLREVVDLVNRVYGVQIEIANSELASCPITVSFRDQTLDAVLNVLELTLDLEVSRKGEKISLDGEGCLE